MRGAEAIMKPGTMMQEVAADQAIMQLMDARGTLMELKVTLLHKFADVHALSTAVYAIAIGNPNEPCNQQDTWLWMQCSACHRYHF